MSSCPDCGAEVNSYGMEHHIRWHKKNDALMQKLLDELVRHGDEITFLKTLIKPSEIAR